MAYSGQCGDHREGGTERPGSQFWDLASELRSSMEPEEEEEEERWDGEGPGGHNTSVSMSRVIVHMDLDCFYAQVEMIRKPELKDKPLGVQQKSIVVTCNYVARNLGVKKLMAVKAAKEICPHLVLVNGEDLTPYRETSYKVTELLEEFCPLVERLGFDENFVDVTEMVEKRLKQQKTSSDLVVAGHVYNNHAIDLHDRTHVALVLGSQIAEDIRRAVATTLGLTSCAGVASNKLLAKLVSGTFKPNQQTVLLPQSRQDLLRALRGVQKIPGIGYKTAKRLETLGIESVWQLQTFPATALEKELGLSLARRIQKLSYGDDDSPVTPSGPPQSFSDEDSFKKCSTEAEVKEKLLELLPNLLERVYKDGRRPHTLRLTIRQSSSSERWFHRESRQCPIPPHLLQRFGQGNANLLSPLVDVLMKLFHKMINVEVPFHLTLLSVTFSNLKELPSTKKGSIGFYLKEMPPKRDREVDDGDAVWLQSHWRTRATKARRHLEEKDVPEAQVLNGPVPFSPHPVDHLEDTPKAMVCGQPEPTEVVVFPPDVDPQTFSELPPDVQEDLMAQWKSQEAISKPLEKPKATNEKRSSAQVNTLLRYLKPR
ncbi:DNA polymerase iota [Cuculus canorus]|uniref:DNA polymerase iota n=1 Tax=Cuculus canorus TaxID=55661 RepID=UPI0023AAF6AB|nr:DNA polymerase iota [Cuculus canorus]